MRVYQRNRVHVECTYICIVSGSEADVVLNSLRCKCQKCIIFSFVACSLMVVGSRSLVVGCWFFGLILVLLKPCHIPVAVSVVSYSFTISCCIVVMLVTMVMAPIAAWRPLMLAVIVTATYFVCMYVCSGLYGVVFDGFNLPISILIIHCCCFTLEFLLEDLIDAWQL